MNIGFSTLAEDLEREVLEVRLNLGIIELATNKTLCIKNTRDQVLGENIQNKWINIHVVGIHGGLVFCSIANQMFVVREGDIGRSCTVSLVVCNDQTFVVREGDIGRSCMVSLVIYNDFDAII